MNRLRSLILGLLSALGSRLRRTPLARIGWLNRLHSALASRLDRRSEVPWGGFRVRTDPRDQVIGKKVRIYGEYETHEIAHLCAHVRPGDHVLDVGANIGLYTLHLSRAAGPEGRVVAVEPDPDTVALLRHNLTINGCANTLVLPCAFMAENGHAALYRVDDNRGKHSLADVWATGQSVEVPVRRGAEALAELGVRPRVAKIDAQGAEPAVLEGLGSRPEVLLLEFAPTLMRAFGRDPVAFLRSLAAAGYRLDLIDTDSGELRTVGPEEAVEVVDRSAAVNFALLVRAPGALAEPRPGPAAGKPPASGGSAGGSPGAAFPG